MPHLCVVEGRLRVDEQVEQNLLELLLVAAHLGARFVQLHVDFDAVRARCERAKTYRVLDNGVDIDRNIARVRLPGEEKKIANHSNGAIRLALDEGHGFELVTLQIVLEKQLRQGRDSGKGIVELVRDAGNELPDRSELLGAAEMVGNLT